MAFDSNLAPIVGQQITLTSTNSATVDTRINLLLDRADATELGLKSGDRVRLVSRRGSLELPAAVDGRGKPPRGSVFVPFFEESRLINELTLDAMDNISKEPDYKKCAVRVERA